MGGVLIITAGRSCVSRSGFEEPAKDGRYVAVKRAVEPAEPLLDVTSVETGVLDNNAACILQIAGPAGYKLMDDHVLDRSEAHAHPAEFDRPAAADCLPFVLSERKHEVHPDAGSLFERGQNHCLAHEIGRRGGQGLEPAPAANREDAVEPFATKAQGQVNIAGHPGFAVELDCLAADDHVGDLRPVELAGQELEQRLKHG